MEQSRAYLIVGASGAIGSAVATHLAGANVGLGLHYNTRETAATTLRTRLEQAGAECESFQSDLADENACRELVARFHERFKSVNGLAICGGTVQWKAWRDLDKESWQATHFEHCIAPFTIASAACELMGQRGNGRIVFLSSIAAKYGGSSKTIHYAAAKSALEAAMRGLAREVASIGITVNAVRAGFIDTQLQRRGRTAEEITERVRMIPAGRAGTPEEVASAIVYLLSDSAGFVTGELITVAGGD